MGVEDGATRSEEMTASVAADASAAAAAHEGSVMDAESSSAVATGERESSVVDRGDDGQQPESDAQRTADAAASGEAATDETTSATEVVPSEEDADGASNEPTETNDDFQDNVANPAALDAVNCSQGDVETQTDKTPAADDAREDDFQENVVDVEHAVKVHSIGTGLMASAIDRGSSRGSGNTGSFQDAHSQDAQSIELSHAGGSVRGSASYYSCSSTIMAHGGTVYSMDGGFDAKQPSPVKGAKGKPVHINETMDVSSDEESGSGSGGVGPRRRGHRHGSYARKPVGAGGCTTTNNRRNVLIAGVVSVALIVLVGMGIGLSKKNNDEAARMAVLMALSRTPSMSPSSSPSVTASDVPSGAPTNVHSSVPSGTPSHPPSSAPSGAPTPSPSFRPSASPSAFPTGVPSASPTVSIAPTTPFLLGDLAIARPDLGIRMSTGLKARLIATTGQQTTYADGTKSTQTFHGMMDGAGIVKLSSGYVYMSNSEIGSGLGGVYGLYFNDAGEVINYKTLLSGTTRNCGGGLSPWNTWISCEEFNRGQCWQIDPDPQGANHATPRETLLGGTGGKYESVACDNSNPVRPVFFTTEDHEFGALRRFEADHGNGWDALHTGGRTTFLRILNGHQFEWTTDEAAARTSANIYYMNAEGISYHDGFVYFTAKKTKTLLILDLENLTYKAETTGGRYEGQGNFNAQPDQILLETHKRWIYFTEDGGNPGVYVRDRHTGTYTALFESDGTYQGDETVGVALSPDRKRFYAGYQDAGKLIEFVREDGLPFE